MEHKTDKELAVELTIALLEHYSSAKNHQGAVTPMRADSVPKTVQAFYKTLKELD